MSSSNAKRLANFGLLADAVWTWLSGSFKCVCHVDALHARTAGKSGITASLTFSPTMHVLWFTLILTSLRLTRETACSRLTVFTFQPLMLHSLYCTVFLPLTMELQIVYRRILNVMRSIHIPSIITKSHLNAPVSSQRLDKSKALEFSKKSFIYKSRPSYDYTPTQ